MSNEAIDETAAIEPVEESEVEVDTEAAQTEDSSDSDEVEQDEEISESSTETESKKDSVQKRIDQLTAEKYELLADREYWRNLNKPQETPKEEAQQPIKTLADFDYDESKFIEYVQSTVTQQAQQQFEQTARQQEAARQEASFRRAEAQFAGEQSDYYAVTNTPGLEISQQLAEEIKGSEMGPQVAYHLGKNPEVSSKLSRMPYKQMMRELVKIETNLSKPKPKVESKTPPPTPKLSGNDKASVIRADSKNSDSLSTEEWMKRRNKQLASR